MKKIKFNKKSFQTIYQDTLKDFASPYSSKEIIEQIRIHNPVTQGYDKEAVYNGWVAIQCGLTRTLLIRCKRKHT